MAEHRREPRTRALRGGKIVFNYGRSVVDCTVRNLSRHGACLELASLVGVPDRFILMMAGDPAKHSCRLVWKTDYRAGAAFEEPLPERREAGAPEQRSASAPPDSARPDGLRAELLALRAGLDEVAFGVVLLDQNLRAQFINRAFRRMWHLPDAKADARPAFAALMRHGRETGAYQVPESALDNYIAERVEHVKAANPAPIDLRLADGAALRFQCIALPAGGRMLSYTPVTDIVRHADELDVLRAALEVVAQGIILLDGDLNVVFVNRAARAFWRLPDKAGYGYADIVQHGYEEGLYDVPADMLDTFVAERVAQVRAGDPQPVDLPLHDGRIVRSQCTALPGGGRMLTYTDVSDLAGRTQAPALVPDAEQATRIYAAE